MKNCPKGCGIPTDKRHCENSKSCNWYICEKDNLVFNADNITKTMPWRLKP